MKKNQVAPQQINPIDLRAAWRAPSAWLIIPLLVLIGLSGCGTAPVRTPFPPLSLAETNLAPWEVAGPVEHYTKQEVDLVLPGHAPVFQSYDIKDIQAVKLGSPAGGVSLVLFECGASHEAFGLYSVQRAQTGLMALQDLEDTDLAGHAEICATTDDAKVLGWQGRFCLTVTALPDRINSGRDLTALAFRLLGGRRGAQVKPKIARPLPEEGLNATSVLYFKKAAALALACTVPEHFLLKIDDAPKTFGVYAHYMFTRYDAEFIAVYYPDNDAAEEVSKKLTDFYRQRAKKYRHSPSGLQEAQFDKNYWMLLWQKGRLLLYVPPTLGVRPARELIQKYLNNLVQVTSVANPEKK